MNKFFFVDLGINVEICVEEKYLFGLNEVIFIEQFIYYNY